MNITQDSLSLPDWFGNRYGSDFVRVGVALLCLFNIFYVAAQCTARPIVFETLLGLPYTLGLVLIAVIVVVCTLGDESFADIYTDAFQALFMLVMGVLVFAGGFWMIKGGGPTGIMQTISNTLSERYPQLVALTNPESTVFYLVQAIIGAFVIQFASSPQPQLCNKVLALRDPRDMAKMILVYVGAALCFLMVVFGGLYAAVVVPGAETDSALLEYVTVAFPPFMAAFLGIVVIAAALSTTDGIFVVMSTAIYRMYIVPRGYVGTPAEDVDRVSLGISRIVTLLLQRFSQRLSVRVAAVGEPPLGVLGRDRV